MAKNNHRRLIVALFNFGEAQGWLSPEPATAADALGAYKVKDTNTEIYTPAELGKMLTRAALEFLPFVALLAFGGVRREELHKGLSRSALDFQAGSILGPAAIAKRA